MVGRGSFIATDVVPYGVENPRLEPPASLGEPEKQAFIRLVCSVPLGQFRECDLPLLCRWCELNVMCEEAVGQMRTQGRVTPDGRVSPWFTIYRDSARELRSLALKLRIGPQSRADKAPKTRPAASISYYEVMRLEGLRNESTETKPD
jgi:phage terminase small subunit